MTTDVPLRRIDGPEELLAAVPYLLGFHPHHSLVLIGLHHGRLVVTARLDLDQVLDGGPGEATLGSTVAAMAAGGTTALLVAVYDDSGSRSIARLAEAAVYRQALDCSVSDVLHVSHGRWYSLSCTDETCCPHEGRALLDVPTAFAAEATVAGIAPLPSRAALDETLAGRPEAARERLRGPIEDVLAAGATRSRRAAVRGLLAAARASADRPDLDDDDVARLVADLCAVPVRDAVWTAVDHQRVDGRPLWRELAARAPAPFDAGPMFLFAWATWRRGDGALAGMAGERVILSDPGYTAADLLLAAVSHGVDPRRLPRLRNPA